MANYKYQDYLDLRNLFSSYLNDEEIEMSQELKQLFWRELKRLQREAQSLKMDNGEHDTNVLLSLDQLMEMGYIPEAALDTEALVEAKDLSKVMHEAICRLDKRSQIIVNMYAEGYTEREIAAVIGGSQKSVNNWKKAAFAKLREFLMDYR